MRTRQITTALLLLLLLARPGVVRAQSGAIANVGVGVASGEGNTDLAINGGVGYRFNRSIGVGVELTHMPGLGSDFDGGILPLGIYSGYPGDDNEGHATIFTTNVRVEIPTTMHRVIPFVVGGGGIASVTQPYPIYYAVPLAASAVGSLPPSLSTAIASLPPQILPGPQFISNTTIAMALTLGGGASILVTDHLAVDVDLRAIQLLGQTGRSMGRFGVGASYRF
jgi:opacity protein-like surface antigen